MNDTAPEVPTDADQQPITDYFDEKVRPLMDEVYRLCVERGIAFDARFHEYEGRTIDIVWSADSTGAGVRAIRNGQLRREIGGRCGG